MLSRQQDDALLDSITWERCEALIAQFEQAWRDGTRPAIEDLLPDKGPERAHLVLELVHAELELRLKSGEPARVEEYVSRFPELRSRDEALIELLRAEFRLRRRSEPDVSAESLQARFPNLPAELAGAVDSQHDTAVDLGRQTTNRRSWPVVAGYEIEGQIGRGGVGVVYVARHLALDRRVAIKVLHAGLCATPAERERFLREGRTIARLRHPNIVQVHEIAESGGLLYLALELAERGSLHQEIGGQPQPATEAARIVATLARAVAHAHAQGVIHRDLKPSNIVRCGDGTLKIADFSVARLADENGAATRTGLVVGSPCYMAPEQAAGRNSQVGPSADIYALGAILYELLTGRPPFVAGTVAETLLQVQFADPPSIRRDVPKVPRDLETICLKCLDKVVPRRYASAAELADDLERFLSGRPVAARRASSQERAIKWMRRHPARAMLIALAVGAAVLVPAALAVHVGQLNEINTALESSARRAAENERQSRRHEYIATVRLAAQHLADGNPSPAEQLLKRWLPGDDRGDDFRGFEWGLMWNDRPRGGVSLHFEQGAPWTYALWRARTGTRELGRLAFSTARTDLSIAGFDSDGGVQSRPLQSAGVFNYPAVWARSEGRDLIAAGTADGIQVWDAGSGTVEATLPAAKQVTALAFSPAQNLLAWASGTEIHVCSWPDGTAIYSRDVREYEDAVALSLGRGTILFYAPGSTNVWRIDPATRAVSRWIDAQGGIMSLTISPCGRLLALGHAEAIEVFSLPSGRRRQSLAAGGAVTLDFIGEDCLASGGGTIQWWSVARGKELGRLRWQNDPALQLHWNGDSSLAVCTVDRSLHHWRLPADTAVHEEHRAVGPLAAAPGGDVIAFADDGNRVWLAAGTLAEPPRLLERELTPVVDLQFSPDGRRLAVLDETLATIWDVSSATVVCSADLGFGTCLRFASDGESIAVGRRDGDVAVCTFDGQSLVRLLGREGRRVTDVAWLSHDRWLAVADGETSVTLLPLRDGERGYVHSPRRVSLVRIATCPAVDHFLLQDATGRTTEFDGRRMPSASAQRQFSSYERRASPGFKLLASGHELWLASDAGGVVIQELENSTVTWNWDFTPNRLVARDSAASFRTADCSADGRYVFAITSHCDLIRWDRDAFTTRRLPHWGLRPVRQLAFSTGGSRLLAGTWSQPMAKIRENNVQPWLRPWKNIKESLETHSIPWERSIDSVRAWNVHDRSEVLAVADLPSRVPQQFVATADRTDRLVTAGDDGSISIWKQGAGRRVKRVYVSRRAETSCAFWELIGLLGGSRPDYERDGEMLAALAVSRDEAVVAAVGRRGGLRTWRLSDGELLSSKTLDSGSAFLAWTADDRRLATSSGTQLRLVDPQTGTIAAIAGEANGSRITAGTVSPDGLTIVTAHDDRTIHVWLLDDGESPRAIAKLPGHLGNILALAITNDNRRLVSGSSDGAIKFWSLETFEEVAHIAKFRGPVYALRFSPDGRYLAAGGEDEHGHGEIHLWDGSFAGAGE